jgi:hypothetical protein
LAATASVVEDPKVALPLRVEIGERHLNRSLEIIEFE